VSIDDVGLEGEDGTAVEPVQVLINLLELVGVAGIKVDLGSVGFAGIVVGDWRCLGERFLGGERGERDLHRFGRRGNDRPGAAELCDGERGAAQKQKCGQDAVDSGHTESPIQL